MLLGSLMYHFINMFVSNVSNLDLKSNNCNSIIFPSKVQVYTIVTSNFYSYVGFDISKPNGQIAVCACVSPEPVAIIEEEVFGLHVSEVQFGVFTSKDDLIP